MRYKILKNLLGYQIGDEIDTPTNVNNLLQDGYIEEIKEVKRWMPESGDAVYFVILDTDLENLEVGSEPAGHPRYYRDENVFRSEETAQLVLDFIKEAFRQLHDPKVYGYESKNNIYQLYHNARHAVQSDNNYDPNWDGVER